MSAAPGFGPNEGRATLNRASRQVPELATAVANAAAGDEDLNPSIATWLLDQSGGKAGQMLLGCLYRLPRGCSIASWVIHCHVAARPERLSNHTAQRRSQRGRGTATRLFTSAFNTQLLP